MFTNKLLKDGLKFYCEKCEYGCNKKYSWNKHLSTTKHQQIVQLNDPKVAEVDVLNSQKKTICICGKEYSCKQTLCVHRKSCHLHIESKNIKFILPKNKTIENLTQSITELLKMNIDLRNENKQLLNLINNIIIPK